VDPPVVSSISRAGVAPGVAPKAETTTGLAPKKASAMDPLVAATESPSEGCDFDVGF